MFLVDSTFDGSGPLDWVILAGFLIVGGGAVVYRVLASHFDWWSDDE